MTIKNKMIMSIIMLILGVMLAMHFQTPQEQEVRETRDTWEIRLQLQHEQDKQQELYNELNELKTFQTQFYSASEAEQITALNESIESLEERAGYTEINEPGILIEIFPEDDEESDYFGSLEYTVELLHRLINELNSYGATHIAINNERLTEATAIRQVDDQIYMNQRPLAALPLVVKATSSDPDRLHSYMEVSQAPNEFAIHDISFELREVADVEIPPYEDTISLQYVKIIDEEEAGEN